MIKTEYTPVRFRTILSESYEKAGNPDFKFGIPQPFTPEMFNVAEVGANPAGLCNQVNQVLAENLANNMAAKIRSAEKNGFPLPTQEDMDALYELYDFSGTRTASGVSLTLFDRIFTRLAGQFVRKLLKKKGYRDMPAPVTVAKKDAEPVGNQISIDEFENEVTRLVEAEGPWAEITAFIEVRNSLIEDAKVEEANVRERQVATESKLASLEV